MDANTLANIGAESKGRGGYRPGAGRPKGPQSAADVEARRRAAQERRKQRPAPKLTSQAKPPRLVVADCLVCGSNFEYMKVGPGRIRRFCTDECRAVAIREHTRASKERLSVGIKKNNYPAVVAPARRYEFTCEVCHRAYMAPKVRGGNKFCSTSCCQTHHSKLRKEATLEGLTTRQCRFCGQAFMPIGKHSRFCTVSCKKTLDNLNKGHRRRSRIGTGTVNPYEVFDRDGWRCQLCGINTPRDLRGTTDPRAPELDHVVPLSLGGAHSYENTQCSCRSCNGLKGAKLDWKGGDHGQRRLQTGSRSPQRFPE